MIKERRKRSLGEIEQALSDETIGQPIKARFNTLYEVAPSGCWTWRGEFKGPEGTARMSIMARTFQASRVSWWVAHGAFPDERYVCHTCDNPACVNPAHLWLGTPKDNSEDAASKGRLGSSKPRGPRLTVAVVASIKRRLHEGDKAGHIARRLGVSVGAVWAIKRGRSWSHVDPWADPPLA